MDPFGDPLVLDPVPPDQVASELGRVGVQLREARLRRNLTIEQVAKAIGVTRRTVAEAEKGNPTTSAGVYVGVFCALGIAYQLATLATTERENHEELAFETDRKRARPSKTRSDW